ncbi:sensor histidine kinase [Kiloniella sp. b19]|uniref:sensor histidine kinase n=1 Tax=Kiloniella sp. GXU_MW_B19 TaxID=3141326 RepID=UPI0031DDA025
MKKNPDTRVPFYKLSALRQALLLTLAFAGVLLLASFFAHQEFQEEFEERIRSELNLRFAVISEEIDINGFQQSAYPDTGTAQVFFLQSPDHPLNSLFKRNGFFRGDRITHETERFHGRQLFSRWSRRHKEYEDDDDDDDEDGEKGKPHHHPRGPGFKLHDDDWMYLVRSTDEGRLVIGTNMGRQELFTEILLQTLLVTGLSTVGISMALGLFLGLRTQKRINAISSVLQRVAGGDMTARLNRAAGGDDLDRLAQSIDDTTARLEILLHQARNFSANIAHDLKTPLTHLRIRLEKTMTRLTAEDTGSGDIGLALEQADRIIAIFDAFLRIAKLEAGTTKASFTPLQLDEIAQEIFCIYEPVVEDSKRSLKLEKSPSPAIEGDRILLIQMLANMIENGLRHTPQGSELTLVASRSELGLRDTGPGIPAEERDKVVQPLYRLEKSRTTEGSGLGLSLIRTIAELHGAELVLSDNEENGGQGLFVRARFNQNQSSYKNFN